MKQIVIAAFFICLTANTFAQEENDFIKLAQKVFQADKKEIIKSNMDISEADAPAFWSLYDEYQDKLKEANSSSIHIIQRLLDVEVAIDTEEAEAVWQTYQKNMQTKLTLQKKYFKKFKKILSSSEAVRYFQVENKIAALINAHLSMEVPLVEK